MNDICPPVKKKDPCPDTPMVDQGKGLT